jgi:hypothetical protein
VKQHHVVWASFLVIVACSARSTTIGAPDDASVPRRDALVGFTNDAGGCASFTTCETCASLTSCGWCPTGCQPIGEVRPFLCGSQPGVTALEMCSQGASDASVTIPTPGPCLVCSSSLCSSETSACISDDDCRACERNTRLPFCSTTPSWTRVLTCMCRRCPDVCGRICTL